MEMLGKGPEGSSACSAVPPSPSFICVTAKSPQGSGQFVLPETSTIQQFKEDIAKRFRCESSQLVLVFFGRILKDQATLRQCGINDGMTVHMVIRARPRDQEETPPLLPYAAARIPTCTRSQSQSSLGSALTIRGTQGSSWGPPEASLSRPEWAPVPTSEMVVQKVRQVILANPEIQQLAQQVPAISHILNNADIMRVILDKMREIMALARNPELTTMQDPKGSADQAPVGLQSNIPGGDNPLRQRNGEGQEPGGLSPGQEGFMPSPYATLARSPCPFPEPGPLQESLGSVPAHPLASPSTTSFCSDEGGLSNEWVRPLGPSPSLPSLAYCSAMEPLSTGGAPNPAEIPLMIVNLCNAYTKRLMLGLMQDALLASRSTQVPGQQEQIKDQVTSLSQQMQSPEVTAAVSNPIAIQAWVQMEQGLQTLRAEAPVLIPWFMLRLRGLEGVAGGGLGAGALSAHGTAIAE